MSVFIGPQVYYLNHLVQPSYNKDTSTSTTATTTTTTTTTTTITTTTTTTTTGSNPFGFLVGYVVQGSNGEYAFMRPDEKIDLVKKVRELAPKDKLVLAGSGCECE